MRALLTVWQPARPSCARSCCCSPAAAPHQGPGRGPSLAGREEGGQAGGGKRAGEAPSREVGMWDFRTAAPHGYQLVGHHCWSTYHLQPCLAVTPTGSHAVDTAGTTPPTHHTHPHTPHTHPHLPPPLTRGAGVAQYSQSALTTQGLFPPWPRPPPPTHPPTHTSQAPPPPTSPTHPRSRCCPARPGPAPRCTGSCGCSGPS